MLILVNINTSSKNRIPSLPLNPSVPGSPLNPSIPGGPMNPGGPGFPTLNWSFWRKTI